MDRISRAADEQDLPRVLTLVEASWAAWSALHDAYRCWFWLLGGALRDEFGEVVALEILEESAWEMVARVLESATPAAEYEWARYWSAHGVACTVHRGDDGVAFEVDSSALVHRGLGGDWARPREELIVDAIMSGVRADGSDSAFGELKLGERGELVHVLAG